MSTPTVTPVSTSIQPRPYQGLDVVTPAVKDPSNAPVDLSAGWTFQAFYLLSNQNPLNGGVVSSATITGNSDGTMHVTRPAGNFAGEPPANSCNLVIQGSTDSFTTRARLATIAINIQQP